MQLYWIPSENRYVRTQGEARQLGFGDVTEVPTDKDGLMNFLTDLRRALVDEQVDEAAPEPAAPAPMTHVDRVMAQCDVEEAIQRATPVELSSYAENVCHRIRELLP
jgi:hypothetical protein